MLPAGVPSIHPCIARMLGCCKPHSKSMRLHQFSIALGLALCLPWLAAGHEGCSVCEAAKEGFEYSSVFSQQRDANVQFTGECHLPAGSVNPVNPSSLAKKPAPRACRPSRLHQECLQGRVCYNHSREQGVGGHAQLVRGACGDSCCAPHAHPCGPVLPAAQPPHANTPMHLLLLHAGRTP